MHRRPRADPLPHRQVIPYAAQPSTAIRPRLLEAGFRCLLTTANGAKQAPTPGHNYAIDNGAWGAHMRSEPFDEAAFAKGLKRWGAEADFVVVPDIVAGGLASLEFSRGWLPRVQAIAPRPLLAVQDGMTPDDVAGLVADGVGIFVGGSTEWKDRTLIEWCRWAAARGAWCHVGRVNTTRRVRLCAAGGATSFDGSGVSMPAWTDEMLGRIGRALKAAEAQPWLL